MAYLIVDPVGSYPAEMMPFVARQLDQGAVAVFSSRPRLALWQGKWSKRVGECVLDTYLASGAPSIAALAAEIRARWPELLGVISWDEESVLLGAALGEALGLGWNSRKVIERCRNKAVMKAHLRKSRRVRVNAGAIVRDAAEARAFQRHVGGWPIVVKPTGGAGSEHVYFARHEADLLRRCQQVLESGDGQVLLEEYVGGLEYCVNGQVDRAGDLLVTDVWVYDRRGSHGFDNLYFETTSVPTRDPRFGQLGEYAARVVEALGLRRAPIHLEVKVDSKGPCIIEIGARPAGGNLPVLASRLHGRSLLELAACHYLGELPALASDVDYERYDRWQAKVVLGVQQQRIPRIRAVHGLAEVQRLPTFADVGMMRPVGTSAPQTIDLETRGWEIYFIGDDPRQVAHDGQRARELLRYE
jgi:ATP-grasp domain-containing protein